MEQYGPYQLISRYELLELIKKTIPDLGIRFNTQIQSLSQNAHEVTVTYNDQHQEFFDLVVAADGLHSQTRSLILKEHEYQYFNTGWVGLVG